MLAGRLQAPGRTGTTPTSHDKPTWRRITLGVMSFDPDDMVQGTGLLSEVNAKIKDARFDNWTYPNTTTTVLAALVTVVTDDGVEEVTPYTIGDSTGKKFQVTDGGDSLTSVAGAEGLPKGSNFAFFGAYLREIGVPKELVHAGKLSLLKGLYAFWQRKPAPERVGLVKTAAQVEKEKRYGPPMVLVPVKLLALPGEKVAKGKAGAGAGLTPVPSASVEEAATEYVLEVLNEKGGRITRKLLGTLAFSKLAKKPLKDEIRKLIATDEFVESLAEVGVGVDDDSLVLVG